MGGKYNPSSSTQLGYGSKFKDGTPWPSGWGSARRIRKPSTCTEWAGRGKVNEDNIHYFLTCEESKTPQNAAQVHRFFDKISNGLPFKVKGMRGDHVATLKSLADAIENEQEAMDVAQLSFYKSKWTELLKKAYKQWCEGDSTIEPDFFDTLYDPDKGVSVEISHFNLDSYLSLEDTDHNNRLLKNPIRDFFAKGKSFKTTVTEEQKRTLDTRTSEVAEEYKQVESTGDKSKMTEWKKTRASTLAKLTLDWEKGTKWPMVSKFAEASIGTGSSSSSSGRRSGRKRGSSRSKSVSTEISASNLDTYLSFADTDPGNEDIKASVLRFFSSGGKPFTVNVSSEQSSALSKRSKAIEEEMSAIRVTDGSEKEKEWMKKRGQELSGVVKTWMNKSSASNSSSSSSSSSSSGGGGRPGRRSGTGSKSSSSPSVDKATIDKQIVSWATPMPSQISAAA